MQRITPELIKFLDAQQFEPNQLKDVEYISSKVHDFFQVIEVSDVQAILLAAEYSAIKVLTSLLQQYNLSVRKYKITYAYGIVPSIAAAGAMSVIKPIQKGTLGNHTYTLYKAEGIYRLVVDNQTMFNVK